MKQKLMLYGFGEHGRVIYHMIKNHYMVYFIDDDINKCNQEYDNRPIVHSSRINELHKIDEIDMFIVTIGNNHNRKNIYDKLIENGYSPVTAIHHSSIIFDLDDLKNGSIPRYVAIKNGSITIPRHVTIKNGSVIMPRSFINTGSVIGSNCIINTGAIIEHDNVIHDHVNINPGVVTGGGVEIGELSMIGMGAIILDHIEIGKECVVGAGSVVTRNVPDRCKVMGVPARIVD